MGRPPAANWDRSHDWVIERTHYQRRRISIRLTGSKPSVAELAAIRRCFPQFANVPPGQLAAQFSESNELEVGVFTPPDATRVAEQAQKAGLRVDVRDASYACDMPHDRTNNSAMLIEDEDLSRATIEEMIEAGVPVHEAAEG